MTAVHDQMQMLSRLLSRRSHVRVRLPPTAAVLSATVIMSCQEAGSILRDQAPAIKRGLAAVLLLQIKYIREFLAVPGVVEAKSHS